jgi:hypothetical protein
MCLEIMLFEFSSFTTRSQPPIVRKTMSSSIIYRPVPKMGTRKSLKSTHLSASLSGSPNATSNGHCLLRSPVELVQTICHYWRSDEHAYLGLKCHHIHSTLSSLVWEELIARTKSPRSIASVSSPPRKLQRDQQDRSYHVYYECQSFHRVADSIILHSGGTSAILPIMISKTTYTTSFPYYEFAYMSAIRVVYIKLDLPRGAYVVHRSDMESIYTSEIGDL